jgi:Kdo2-lipid IVA lauroyltransferase/acyltransferase
MKPRSRLADYAVYLIVRMLVCVLQGMSFSTGRNFGSALAWLAYHIDKRHRRVALENLRHAFPGRFSEPQLQQLVLDCYRHFAAILIEMIYFPRILRVTNYKKYVRFENMAEAVRCFVSGRPMLIVTGHFGNWEMAGYALGLVGFKTYAIARPLDNPYLESFAKRFRERTGQTLLAKKGDFERIEQILKEGGIISTLGDQDAGQRGLFVNFFNRPASTHKAIALLALEHRAALAVCVARKTAEPIQYVVHCEDLMTPANLDAEPGAVRGITQRFTSALERLIRLDPKQYFWLHRRWKHQPAAKKSKSAA